MAGGADSAVKINTRLSRSQTFTVDISRQFTGIDLRIRESGLDAPANDLLFDVLPAREGVPSGAPPGSDSIATGSVLTLTERSGPTFVFIDLSAFDTCAAVDDVLTDLPDHQNSGIFGDMTRNTP